LQYKGLSTFYFSIFFDKIIKSQQSPLQDFSMIFFESGIVF